MTNQKRRFILMVAGLLSFSAMSRAQTAADQAQAIDDLLTVIEGEKEYATHNCGWFSALFNLCRFGGNCAGVGMPNYPTSAPDFIDGTLGRTSPYIEANYLREWVPGARPDPFSYFCDPNSVLHYCYAATPADPASGRPSFAATGDGTIYINRSGGAIACPVAVGTATLEWPSFLHPKPGTRLEGSSVTFTWAENDVPVESFRLLLGTAPGSDDIYDTSYSSEFSVTVDGLPTSGIPVYARLLYLFADRWQFIDARYRAYNPRSQPRRRSSTLLFPVAFLGTVLVTITLHRRRR